MPPFFPKQAHASLPPLTPHAPSPALALFPSIARARLPPPHSPDKEDKERSGSGGGGGGGGTTGGDDVDGLSEKEIHVMLIDREKARVARDFGAADVIRDKLQEHGVTVDDRRRVNATTAKRRWGGAAAGARAAPRRRPRLGRGEWVLGSGAEGRGEVVAALSH